MKILFINDNHQHTGGAETYLFDLMSALRSKEVQIYFFSMSSEKKSDDEFSCIYLDIRKNRILDHFCRNYFNPFLYHELRKKIRKNKPDIIHLNNISKYQNSIVLAALKEKVPLIQTIHDIRVVCPIGTGVKVDVKVCDGGLGIKCLINKCLRMKSYIYLFYPWKIRQLLNRYGIRYFIVLSNSFKNILESKGWRNIIFMPFFINYKACNNKINTRKDLLFVGSLIDIKGLQYLIKSMPKIIKQFPESKLHIVGDGSEKTKYETIVKDLRLQNNIIFHGKVPNEKVINFYKKSFLFIMPSICIETFGLVGLEAMASGLPVIGSNIGGIPEWLEDGKTGFLVEPGNIEQISNNIIRILSDEKLANDLAENARKRAENWPSQDEYVDKLIKVYMKIMRG